MENGRTFEEPLPPASPATPAASGPTAARRRPRTRTPRWVDVQAVRTFAESLARSYEERIALTAPGELHRV